MLAALVSALVLSPALQRPKLAPLPNGKRQIRTVAWLPPFVPLIAEPARAQWREKILAALNKPKVDGAYVGYAAERVKAEMLKRKMDPAAQKSTWTTDDLVAVGVGAKARYVGMVDVHPIQPNVGATKELVGVFCHTTVVDLATKKTVMAENVYDAGAQPVPGKGSYADGLPVAVRIAEKLIPQTLKQRLEKK